MSDRDSVVTVDELDESEDRGHARPSERDEGKFRRSDSGRNDFGIQDLASKILQIQSKRYYLDIKQNKRGRFLKLSEVEGTGQKNRLTMDMATCAEFHDQLTEFSEYFASIGPKSQGDIDRGKLKSETIFSGDRRYYLDLKENNRGRFLKVSMTLPPPSHERQQIIIPAQGMIDIRDTLTDLLSEFGGTGGESQSVSVGSGEASASAPANGASSGGDGSSLRIDSKTFYFDVGDNKRGTYLRISEVSPNFRTAINVPEQAWEQFKEQLRTSTKIGKKTKSFENVPEEEIMLIE